MGYLWCVCASYPVAIIRLHAGYVWYVCAVCVVRLLTTLHSPQLIQPLQHAWQQVCVRAYARWTMRTCAMHVCWMDDACVCVHAGWTVRMCVMHVCWMDDAHLFWNGSVC